MNSPVDKIKERLSILDVVSSYIEVIKSGKSYKAKCPFHNEKTPSFFISQERQAYYCFGCGAKGDIFSFVEHFEGLDFMGALKLLAEKAGVPLNYERGNNSKNDKDRYYKILEEATEFFQNNLKKNKEAINYLKKRGLNDETISLFRIGYALDEWHSLLNHLSNKGYKKEDLEIIGLIKKSENNHYDRFRSRIIFPITDSSGRTIAFTGRIFPEIKNKEAPTEVVASAMVGAKYLNSPETPLFSKSDILFGIDKAKSYIRQRNYSIIVEGQMDLLMSHQAGFTNTVAVSGTALTDNEDQKDDNRLENNKINNLGLIKRLSRNVILAFDGDEAGQRAASRSAMIALSLDMQVKIAVLPIGLDPADIILDNKEEWKKIIKESVNIISFLIDKICQNSKEAKIRGRKTREIIFPFLNVIESSIERVAYINEISQKINIPTEAILVDFKKYQEESKNKNIKENKAETGKDLIKEKNSRQIDLEDSFMGIIFWLEDKKETEDEIKKITNILMQSIGEKFYLEIYENHKNNKEELAFKAEMWYGGEIEKSITDMKELALNLEEEILNNRLIFLRSEINEKNRLGKKEEQSEDLVEYQKIIGRVEEIKSLRKK